MRILNRNTFSEDEVTTKKMAHPSSCWCANCRSNHSIGILVYIGKSCYSLKDLEALISKIKVEKSGDEKFIESLNYRVSKKV